MAIRSKQLETQTGVAGSYTNLDATINNEGIVTAAANGTPGGGSNSFAAVAGETIAVNAVVYVELVGGLGTPGYVYNADSGSAGKSTAAFLIGISTTSAASSGDPVTVQWGGLVSGFTGLVDGTVYFLGGTGSLSTVGAVLVGVAISSTQLILNTRGSQSVLAPYQLFPQTNLILWLDSSVGVTLSGSNITTWSDQSSSGADMQAYSGNATVDANIFGTLPGIFFDSTNADALLNTTYPWHTMTAVSVYAVVVWETQVSGTNYPIVGTRNSNGPGDTTWAMYINNTPQMGNYNGTTFTPRNLTVSPSQATILSIIGDIGAATAYQDGGSVGSTASLGVATSDTLYIGRQCNGLPEYWKGHIGSLLVYGTKLNSTDDMAVISYLKSRFAIP